jgi:hypothetical protein
MMLWWTLGVVLAGWFAVNLVCGALLLFKADRRIRHEARVSRQMMSRW